MQYVGLFYARRPQALMGTLDAPYSMLGRHALSARDMVSDGGAMACAVGLLRNEHALIARLTEAGIRIDAEGGLSHLTLAAYRLWGERYPEHLEGPIATVVVDQDAGRLVISRDRMGERRVFYAARGASVAFADHPIPLLDAPFVSRVVDRVGLNELFALGPARTPGLTPIRDIRALEPGCVLVADGTGQEIRRYFSLEARPHEDDLTTTIDQVRYLVEDALEGSMSLHPASMLSGGLDSTVLSALAVRAGQLDTWSVGYEDDERHFAQNDYQHERDAPFIDMAAGLLGTNHRRVTLTPAALVDALHDAMTARGFPGMADVDSSLLLFARAIGGHSRYVLSGECSDEVFGGYPWFHRTELIHRDGFPWSGSLALRASVLKRAVREKADPNAYAAARYHEAAARLPRLAGEGELDARLRLLHGLCFEYFMPVLQERAGALCASANLTVLTPYCDDRLAQYVYNVPWAVKNLNGQEKGLLREAMKGLLPDELINRRKSPYPKTHHPRYTRLVVNRMTALLDDATSPLMQVVDADAVRALMSRGLSASETPWYGQLMSGPQMIAYLLQIDDWLKTYELEIEL